MSPQPPLQLDLLSTEHPDSKPKGPALRKLYYTIGEVSELIGVPAHVLRYWETEFSVLHPKKGKGGNRLYQERDVKLLEQIRSLLYDQKFTIAGARVQLDGKPKANGNPVDPPVIAEVRQELKEILSLLNR
ncbi:MerR family transcriptional regulator [candidate division KSB1 bacterium]|nr:MerR family transcriptional regulator [candidate division KSB1 bacterium]